MSRSSPSSSTASPGDPKLNQGDGIHPTAEGQAIVAETIWQHLQPLLTP
jgi:lysophospholipase L1-like esterase